MGATGMNKFKAGDKVVRTGRPHLGVVKGGVYTVRSCNGEYEYTMSLEECAGKFDTGMFDLVEPEIEVPVPSPSNKFKVGDMVVRTGFSFGEVVEGLTYTVTAIEGYDEIYVDHSEFTYISNLFDLVEPELTCPEPIPTHNPITQPSHYTIGNEVRPFVKSWDLGYNESNIIKYLIRSPYKGKELQDLYKALDCLQDHIKDVIAKEDN